MESQTKPSRGRPALFGQAGAYERAYAAVTRATYRRMVEAAHAEKCSLSRLLHQAVVTAGTDPGDPPPAEARVYVQLPLGEAALLRTKAAERGWALAGLLGSIAERAFGLQKRARLAT